MGKAPVIVWNALAYTTADVSFSFPGQGKKRVGSWATAELTLLLGGSPEFYSCDSIGFHS